jgi:hypothetical protein
MGFIGSNYLEIFQKRYFYISAMLAAIYDRDKVYAFALQHFLFGGWVLIGRKTNAVTWTAPSDNKTVGTIWRNSLVQWSSSLGGAPIVADFRVQLATQEDFSATKTHWWVHY